MEIYEYRLRHFGFHPYHSPLKRSCCKHLQAMPVKVADRLTLDCVDAVKTGSQDSKSIYTDALMSCQHFFLHPS